MVMEDNESCSSRVVESTAANRRHQRLKLEVFNEVLWRLKDSDNIEAKQDDFDDELWAHFNRLPTRYALDVNVERAEDVLTHKRLLQEAHDPAKRPVFDVRLVQVSPSSNGHNDDSINSSSPRTEVVQSIHPPPAFGSSPNLEALAIEANKSHVQDGDSATNACAKYSRPMHEITFSADDKPKLLSQLTSLLAEIGLNIQEGHAFSTVDGYSLDVFVVDGWPYEETEQLRTALAKEIRKLEVVYYCSVRLQIKMSQKIKEGDTVKREQLMWTPAMDDIFIKSMLNQQYEGNRHDGSFTSTAYANMVSELKDTLKKDFTKAHLKNRLKTLKEHFAQCYDLFRGVGLSGFSWNSETKVFEAEEEVWEQLIAARPDAIKWKTKQVMNYDELHELFAKDRATGAGAETAKEKNKQKLRTSTGSWNTIEEIDSLLSEKVVNLENFSNDSEFPYGTPTPSVQEPLSNSMESKGKKRKLEDGEEISKKIMASLENVADAMRKTNIIMERSQQRVYTEEEIYNELEVIGLNANEICGAYLFLIKHPENARALFGCPLHMKKIILEEMMKKGD